MRDTITEQILDDEGVPWVYERHVAWEQIAVTDETLSQVRIGGTSSEFVERYTINAKGGGHKRFPALVIGPDGAMIDGHTRRQAFKAAGVPGHDAYRIKTDDPVVIERLRRTLNATNGQPLTDEQLKAQGRMLVTRLGYTRERAAKEVGVSAPALTSYVRAQELADELIQDGADAWTVANIPQTRLLEINKVKRPNVRLRLVPLAFKCKSLESLETVVDEVRGASSDDEAIQAVAEWMGKLDARSKNGRQPKRPLASLPTLLARVVREAQQDFDPNTLSADERDKVVESVRDAIPVLNGLVQEVAGVAV